PVGLASHMPILWRGKPDRDACRPPRAGSDRRADWTAVRGARGAGLRSRSPRVLADAMFPAHDRAARESRCADGLRDRRGGFPRIALSRLPRDRIVAGLMTPRAVAATATFIAAGRVAQHFGRSGTIDGPQSQYRASKPPNAHRPASPLRRTRARFGYLAVC